MKEQNVCLCVCVCEWLSVLWLFMIICESDVCKTCGVDHSIGEHDKIAVSYISVNAEHDQGQ